MVIIGTLHISVVLSHVSRIFREHLLDYVSALRPVLCLVSTDPRGQVAPTAEAFCVRVSRLGLARSKPAVPGTEKQVEQKSPLSIAILHYLLSFVIRCGRVPL